MTPIRGRRTLPAAVLVAVQIAAVALAAVPVALIAATASPSEGVLARDGAVDPVAYRRLAAHLATASGIRYRFGEAATAPTTTSTVYAAPLKPYAGDGNMPDLTYQVGGPQRRSSNDFSSDQGQVGYVAQPGAAKVGVDHVETLSMGQNTFSEQPRLSWTYYGGGRPEPDVLPDSSSGKCVRNLGLTPGRFVAQARAYAHGEATANSLIAFDNGVIVAAGTNTARADACTKLPAHLRPSAISITNGNEFALVTAWNTTTLRSELVVIALGGARQRSDFWGYEWQQLYPGLRNAGRPTFAKVLGSVPLPVAAATSVSAVSDNSLAAPISRPGGGTAVLGDLTLSDEANRRSFISGTNRHTIAGAGYAVIASREEKKVVFVDLQPLFQRITQDYFRSRTEFQRITSTVGGGSTQWPYAFSAAPKERPSVVKTVSTTAAPTAVAAGLSGGSTPRAYVATVDGRLHVYSTRGLATVRAAAPSTIQEVGTVRVGLNPTSITYVKDRSTGHALGQTLDNTLIVTARGSRAVQWIRLKGSGGRIVRTLRDTRLIDPIAAEDNNTHGTESYVLSVADYGGSSLLNYRYGPVIFHTNGGSRFGVGPAGRSAFEFGGAYRPRGHPFSISITNVT